MCRISILYRYIFFCRNVMSNLVCDNKDESSKNVPSESSEKDSLMKRMSNEEVCLKKLAREQSVELVDDQIEGFGSKRFCMCFGQSYEEMKEENINVYYKLL